MPKRSLPNNYKLDLYLKVSSLNQGRMSVKQYVYKFEQLQIRSGFQGEEQQTMLRFLRGLDPGISEKLELQTYWSFEEICKLVN